MLLTSFSEKRIEQDLTGKFGLGFKSVHVLSDSVGMPTDLSHCARGFVPTQWAVGIDEAEVHRRAQ